VAALVNQQHEAFCQAYARGGTQWEAYLVAFPACSKAAARSGAPRLLARPEVVARIEEIRRELPPVVEPASEETPISASVEQSEASKTDESASKEGDDTSNPAADPAGISEGASSPPPDAITPPPSDGVLDAEVVDPPVAVMSPEERREIYSRWGRAKRLVNLHDKLSTLLWERGHHPDMQDVPGGKTGLVLVRHKTIRQGDEYKAVKEYSTDTGLVAEIRALLQQTAAELGQWYEHRVLSETETAPALAAGAPDLRGLSLEELETLRQLYSKAAETAVTRLTPPA
jgi:hypothetical protein